MQCPQCQAENLERRSSAGKPGYRRDAQSSIVDERQRPDIPLARRRRYPKLRYDEREGMLRSLASPEEEARVADCALLIERIKTFTVDDKVIIAG